MGPDIDMVQRVDCNSLVHANRSWVRISSDILPYIFHLLIAPSNFPFLMATDELPGKWDALSHFHYFIISYCPGSMEFHPYICKMLSSHSYYNIMMSIHVYSVYDSIRNLYLYISVSCITYSLYLFHLQDTPFFISTSRNTL